MKARRMKDKRDYKKETTNDSRKEPKVKEIKRNESTKKQENKKNNNHKAIKVIGIILLIIVTIFGAIYLAGSSYINAKLGKIKYQNITTDEKELGIDTETSEQMKKFRNIALLGLDSRYDTYDSEYRTDCIMVASINKENNDVQLYSIYRDTYVQMELDGKTTFDKINHAYYNGVENTLKTINTNLDLNITEYAIADFNAVVDLVNAVDGVDIAIETDELQYINSYIDDVKKVTGETASHITKAGTQHLNGVQALAYCRIRYTKGLDYKRTERMRTVLEKILIKIKKMSITKINSLLDKMLPEVSTNIKSNEILQLLPKAISFNIKSSFGWPYTTTGVYIGGDFYGPAKTLESNVLKLHQEVYGQENYKVPTDVEEISQKIIEKTGVK